MTPERLGPSIERLGEHGNVFADHRSGSGWDLSLSYQGQQVRGRGRTLCEAWDAAQAKIEHDSLDALGVWMRNAEVAVELNLT